MKKLILLCFMVFYLFGCVQSRSSQPVTVKQVDVFGQEQAFAPKYNEGERWIYDVKVDYKGSGYSFDKLQSGVYEFKFINGKIRGNREFREKYFGNIYGPLPPDPFTGRQRDKLFHFPLHVGKKWSYRYLQDSNRRRERGRWQTADVKVVGFETVTTKVGTFKAFKITRDEERGSTVYWYSPKIKGLLKFRHERYHRSINETSTYTSELSAYHVQGK